MLIQKVLDLPLPGFVASGKSLPSSKPQLLQL